MSVTGGLSLQRLRSLFRELSEEEDAWRMMSGTWKCKNGLIVIVFLRSLVTYMKISDWQSFAITYALVFNHRCCIVWCVILRNKAVLLWDTHFSFNVRTLSLFNSSSHKRVTAMMFLCHSYDSPGQVNWNISQILDMITWFVFGHGCLHCTRGDRQTSYKFSGTNEGK